MDFERRVLRFGTQLKRDMTFKGPKTAAGKRVIPLPGFAVEALKMHKVMQDREQACARRPAIGTRVAW